MKASKLAITKMVCIDLPIKMP